MSRCWRSRRRCPAASRLLCSQAVSSVYLSTIPERIVFLFKQVRQRLKTESIFWTIHGCFLHPRFDYPTFSPPLPALSTPRIVHWFCGRREVVAYCLSTETLDGIATGGLGKVKCGFEFLKKCLKRKLNPRSPVCQAPMLTIRPLMVG